VKCKVFDESSTIGVPGGLQRTAKLTDNVPVVEKEALSRNLTQLHANWRASAGAVDQSVLRTQKVTFIHVSCSFL